MGDIQRRTDSTAELLVFKEIVSMENLNSIGG